VENIRCGENPNNLLLIVLIDPPEVFVGTYEERHRVQAKLY